MPIVANRLARLLSSQHIQQSVVAVQVAYLASSLFLDHDSDLIILVVNTLTQDLRSDNYLTGVLALSSLLFSVQLTYQSGAQCESAYS